jgi:hypothetical protein
MMRERGLFLNVVQVSPMKDKLAKNRPFQARARERAIYLPKRGANQPEWLFDLEHQLRRFPRGNLKDIVDSGGVVISTIDKHCRPSTVDEIRRRRERDVYEPIDAVSGM